MKTADLSAVILAAGLSSRMKNFKPLLPCGRSTMVETAIDLFAENRVTDIVVVTGHRGQEIEHILGNTIARPVFNPDFKSGMLSSIQKGVDHIRPESDGFFLLPVDIPAIRHSTVRQMTKVFTASQDRIIMPCFDRRPGHPPLIPRKFRKQILRLAGGQTLRDLIFSDSSRIVEFPVHDRGILMDADDPAAYQKICDKINASHAPDKEECLSIINTVLPENDGIRRHLADVSMTAVKLAHAVDATLDIDTVIAAALLHDVKRKEKHHAQQGARLVRELGFPKVADIIEQHMDIEIEPDTGLKEKEIVYFADKICNGSGPDLNYHRRFAKALKKCPWAMASISKRYENTKTIHARIEASARKPVEAILTA